VTARTASLAVLLLAACDDSQAWHDPDFSLGRMQEQPRVDPFDEAMSAPPPFTVARASPGRPPLPVTRAEVEEGRRRFDAICASCHGVRGDGDCVVATKMLLRPPPSLLEARIQALTDEQLDQVVARGYGLMPSFEDQIGAPERVGVVAYVRALQISQEVDVAILPAPLAAALAQRAP
jgi:mono/diheme cytochrome c family protein